MRRMALLGIACILASALTLIDTPHVRATQAEQARHYRAKTIALFKELMQLKREGVLVFSVFEGVTGPSFGVDNPRAYVRPGRSGRKFYRRRGAVHAQVSQGPQDHRDWRGWQDGHHGAAGAGQGHEEEPRPSHGPPEYQTDQSA